MSKIAILVQFPGGAKTILSGESTILGLEKTMLHEICVSGTVGGPLLTQKSSTCAYIRQKSR